MKTSFRKVSINILVFILVHFVFSPFLSMKPYLLLSAYGVSEGNIALDIRQQPFLTSIMKILCSVLFQTFSADVMSAQSSSLFLHLNVSLPGEFSIENSPRLAVCSTYGNSSICMLIFLFTKCVSSNRTKVASRVHFAFCNFAALFQISDKMRSGAFIAP